ncbi:MAG: phosphate-starvation-inducible PsiE family protein [Candidatus Hydrothermarchaeales archaeon]
MSVYRRRGKIVILDVINLNYDPMVKDVAHFLEKVPHRLFGIIGLLILILIGMTIIDFFELLAVGASQASLLANVLHSLILVELLHLSLVYAVTEVIDPQELILIILTAIGRKLITTEDIYAQDPLTTIALGIVLLICIYGLKVTKVTYKTPTPQGKS